MKIAILGAGALGSILGAHLVRAGEDVLLIARGRRAAFVRDHGLTIIGLADFTVPVPIVEDPRLVQDADVLIVAVKTYDTESALRVVRDVAAASVLSVQNGVYKNEQLARHFGWKRTLGAAAAFSGEVMPEGAVRFTLNDGFYLGELPEGTSARVESLAATLTRAGINAVASPQIRSVEWSKYVFFVGHMAIAALTRLETYKFLRDPDLAYLRVAIEREVAQIAARLSIPLGDYGMMPTKTLTSLPIEEAVAHVRLGGERLVAARATAHKVSTLQDLERGRRLEVEETLGYAVRRGEELGLQLPTLNICYRLLTGINRHLQ
jgi:2-dehydropantoate 2-reductase